jgi:hypothetical protein
VVVASATASMSHGRRWRPAVAATSANDHNVRDNLGGPQGPRAG